MLAVFQQLDLIAFAPATFHKESPHLKGHDQKGVAMSAAATGWRAGAGIFDVDPVQS